MPSELSFLLRKFIAIYQREPFALERALDSPTWVDTEDIPLHEQARSLSSSNEKGKQTLLRKALIVTSVVDQRLDQLQKELGDSREAKISRSSEELWRLIHEGSVRRFEEANALGLIPEDHTAQREQARQESIDLRTEVLYYFADHLDSFTASVDSLRPTDLNRIVDESLQELLSQCHVNFALGHFATTCIMCGVILERTLRTLLLSRRCVIGEKDGLGTLIKMASKQSLFRDPKLGLKKSAWIILKYRNDAAHADAGFNRVTSRDVESIIRLTRELTTALHKN